MSVFLNGLLASYTRRVIFFLSAGTSVVKADIRVPCTYRARALKIVSGEQVHHFAPEECSQTTLETIKLVCSLKIEKEKEIQIEIKGSN